MGKDGLNVALTDRDLALREAIAEYYPKRDTNNAFGIYFAMRKQESAMTISCPNWHTTCFLIVQFNNLTGVRNGSYIGLALQISLGQQTCPKKKNIGITLTSEVFSVWGCEQPLEMSQ